MAFLLVWDKDQMQGDSLCCFHAHMYYNPQLVHLFQTFTLLLSPYPILASASLRLLYLLLYSGYKGILELCLCKTLKKTVIKI
jgi:hypothetical protein